MYDSIKVRVEQAKQFASDHPTLVACAASSLITWKMTRDSVLKDTAGMVHAAGSMIVAAETQRDILLSYVNAKGLENEVREYVASMAR